MDKKPTASTTPSAPEAPAAPQPPAAPVTPAQLSSNKGLIIGLIVAGVILVFGAIGVTLAVVLGNKPNDNQHANHNSQQQPANNQGSDEDALRAANAQTASSLTQFNVVCDNGSISNASAYEKPYKVAAFAKNSTTRSASNVSLGYNSPYRSEYSKYEKVNVVACLDEKPGSAVKSKTCDFKTGGKKVALDYYALKYTVTLREAKTGKLIKELGDINAPATTCPYFVTYDKSDPKYYARPDSAALDAALEEFYK